MRMIKNTFIIATSILASGLIGCGGGNTDGGAEGFGDEIFTGGDDSVGRVEVMVDSSSVAVGRTTGFQAYAYDSQSRPIKDIRLICDSEAGVKILEPVSTTGGTTQSSQLTGTLGSIGGTIGCEDSGSFKFGCRMPVRTNRKAFVDIQCTGAVPPGFNGFPNAAGGNLGGGAVSPGDQGKADLRLTKVQIRSSDSNTSNSDQIDVLQGFCIKCDDITQTNEPFSDDYAYLTLTSSNATRITLTGVQYEIAGVGRSELLPVTGEISAAGSSEIAVLVFRANGPAKEYVIGDGQEISDETGFKAVTFTVFGETVLGETVAASGSTTLSFQNYNRCPGDLVPNEAQCPQP